MNLMTCAIAYMQRNAATVELRGYHKMQVAMENTTPNHNKSPADGHASGMHSAGTIHSLLHSIALRANFLSLITIFTIICVEENNNLEVETRESYDLFSKKTKGGKLVEKETRVKSFLCQ